MELRKGKRKHKLQGWVMRLLGRRGGVGSGGWGAGAIVLHFRRLESGKWEQPEHQA